MSHIFRFHAVRRSELDWVLGSEEWHHLLKVLRLGPGTHLELADGKGWSAQGILLETGKSQGVIAVNAEHYTEAPAPDRLICLALGAVKPQSVDDILPSITELGVDLIWVFPFSGMAKSRLNDKVKERWDRVLAASAKQCKRAWWPSIVWLESFEDFLKQASDFPHRLVLDPEGELSLGAWRAQPEASVLAAVGSEKGLSPEELKAMVAQGFQKVSLRGSILRSITASIAAAALLRHNAYSSSPPL